MLSKKYDIVARFNGGANAGHTVYKGKIKYAFHQLPCGILEENTKNLIGNGVVLNLKSMFK
jgi:adenylosuccinate synthase